jgi:hypothetical protein
LADDAERLIDQVTPIANETREEEFLHVLRPSSGYEPGANRQRRMLREGGNWQTIVGSMKTAWAAEIDAWTAGQCAGDSLAATPGGDVLP